MKSRRKMVESLTIRWQNQEEAFQFALSHKSCMLDMDMGTGKTRVAIDVAFARKDCYRVLVVCPKAVVPVWRENLEKFAPNNGWSCWDLQKGSVKAKMDDLQKWMKTPAMKQFIVINYDCVWRKPMGDMVLKCNPQMVILDESHRAKAAGSKVSKYLAMLGKRVQYKMCLSGTPMANSPLDVYGQYRFLDPSIFGTNHNNFLGEYAIMGGPEKRFVVGYRNQQRLNEKFRSIAYSCKMSDVADKIKLPDSLPPVKRMVSLPAKDRKIMKGLNDDFIAECNNSVIAAGNVLTKMIRLQQIASGFCFTQTGPLAEKEMQELNTSKEDTLSDMLTDIGGTHVVVFCVFKHDLDAVARSADKSGMKHFELSGRVNELDEWKKEGGVFAVQIQAGAEGVDMTLANHAIYYSLPHSLALYNQSKARLYRPGQTRPVSFTHLIAEKTIDEAMYKALMKKEDIIESIKNGTFDTGCIK
jgi:SNF2 family DNA or RNA helicase